MQALRRHWTAAAVSIAIGTPLFLSVTGGRIGPPTGPSAEARGSSIAVPISLLIICVALLAVSARLRSKRKLQLGTIALVVFVVVNLVAYTYGSFSDRVTGNSLAFLIQTLIPVLGYVYGTQLFVDRSGTLKGTYYKMLWIPAASMVAVALSTLLAGGQPWIRLGDSIGPIDIPQIRRFVPTVAATALVGLGYLTIQSGKLTMRRVAPLLIALIPISAAHSRTSLLLVIAGVLVSVVGDPSRQTARTKLVVLAWCMLAGLVVITAIPTLTVGPTALNRLIGDNESAQISTERRYGALISSLGETVSRPLGRAYSADEGLTLGGQLSGVQRVSNSENQLGEYGLRAGPVALAAIAVFIYATLRDSRRLLLRAPPSEDNQFMAAIWIAVTAAVFVSALTQQAMSQPFSGLYLWFMLGLLRGWTIRIAEPSKPKAPRAYARA